MSIKAWIWKSVVAGFAGSVVHLAFMYVKLTLGILPTFQPYPAFQATLSHWAGTNVPAIVPWLLSFLNGMTILQHVPTGVNRDSQRTPKERV